MTDSSDETSLAIAQQNATRNQQRLIQALPTKTAQRARRLVANYTRHKGNADNKLSALFDDIAVIYASVAPFTACKRGCSACCHYPVSISEVEIRRIERHTGYRRQPDLPRYDVEHSAPCPFLEGGECGIYAHRPYVCRTHTALTNTAHWCDPVRSNDAEFPMVSFTEVQKSFDFIRCASAERRVRDIREVFARPSAERSQTGGVQS